VAAGAPPNRERSCLTVRCARARGRQHGERDRGRVEPLRQQPMPSGTKATDRCLGRTRAPAVRRTARPNFASRCGPRTWPFRRRAAWRHGASPMRVDGLTWRAQRVGTGSARIAPAQPGWDDRRATARCSGTALLQPRPFGLHAYERLMFGGRQGRPTMSPGARCGDRRAKRKRLHRSRPVDSTRVEASGGHP